MTALPLDVPAMPPPAMPTAFGPELPVEPLPRTVAAADITTLCIADFNQPRFPWGLLVAALVGLHLALAAQAVLGAETPDLNRYTRPVRPGRPTSAGGRVRTGIRRAA